MKHSLSETTDLLYLKGIEGSYIKETDVSIIGYENGGYVLDKTMMHYQGGGQPGDKGYIVVGNEKIRIYNVIKKGRKIIHLSMDVKEAKSGKLMVNWERRYKIMKMHTLQHALSSFFFKEGAMTLESEVFPGYGYVTLDKELKAIPDEAYDISKKSYSLKRFNLSRKELDPNVLKRCNLEKLPKSVDVLSIVEIENIDVCACAGTHVSNTKEIGNYWIRNMGKVVEFGLF